MPLQTAFAVENNFSKGLITEASGLNFPENACTETWNCEFGFTGASTRRLGFEFEDNYSLKTIDRSNKVIKTYLWRNVSGDGSLTLTVLQIGSTLYFYKGNVGPLSGGAVSTTVTLTSVSGAPTPEDIECQFCDGNGFLFVTHPYLDPIRVSYDATTDTATATTLTLKIRDFEGAIADVLAVDTRPTTTLGSMDVNHKYNLYNQGWTTTNLTAWDTAQTTMPSNADVMWRFKNSTDDFDASNAAIARVVGGNTPASKGHFVLTLSNQDRDTAAGTSGVAATTSGYQRPSTGAFFAGRVFYAGTNYTGFNSNIYFTQIVERSEQYAFCYQVNDPTSQDEFDLLPSDGGVIRIPEAGTIYKLYSIPGGLCVFAANGVWFITGSTGLGFTATDFSVQKIAYISTISATSFVDVMGFPTWWNAEGIYVISAGEGAGLPKVSSMTDTTIKSFYADIPLSSRRNARGFYHPIEKKIFWLFKSTSTEQLTESYEYDRILVFNARTGAFYPWSVDNTNVNIHSLVVTDASIGSTSVETVVDGSSVTVVDGVGNTVVAFILSGSATAPLAKFLVSYNDGSYRFTFAQTKNTNYVDWFQFDTVGVDYTSYFISGYKLRGNAINKFQSNWVKIYSDISDDNSNYTFRGVWDYSTSSNTHRWSTAQTVTHAQGNYSHASRRLKVRGHGVALQFKVTSVSGEPFDIIGWSSFDSGNQIP